LAAFVVLRTAFALRCFCAAVCSWHRCYNAGAQHRSPSPRLPPFAFKGFLAQTLVTVVSAVIGIAALAGGVQN
jgi:hypothetical protein